MKIEAVNKKFRLKLYENRDFKPGGDTWMFRDDKPFPSVPNDEVAAFTLVGDPGVTVYFFNSKSGDKKAAWGEVTLTNSVTSVKCGNLDKSVSTYKFHKSPYPNADKLAGKVSLVKVKA